MGNKRGALSEETTNTTNTRYLGWVLKSRFHFAFGSQLAQYLVGLLNSNSKNAFTKLFLSSKKSHVEIMESALPVTCYSDGLLSEL